MIQVFQPLQPGELHIVGTGHYDLFGLERLSCLINFLRPGGIALEADKAEFEELSNDKKSEEKYVQSTLAKFDTIPEQKFAAVKYFLEQLIASNMYETVASISYNRDVVHCIDDRRDVVNTEKEGENVSERLIQIIDMYLDFDRTNPKKDDLVYLYQQVMEHDYLSAIKPRSEQVAQIEGYLASGQWDREQYDHVMTLFSLEREESMAKAIEACVHPEKSVLAIVGAGHLEGLLDLLPHLKPQTYPLNFAAKYLSGMGVLDRKYA